MRPRECSGQRCGSDLRSVWRRVAKTSRPDARTSVWFRDPSGNEYRSLEKAAEAAASLLSESETETESSNKRSRSDDDDDDDDAPSSKRPRRSELHSLLVRLCKVGNIPYEDKMDTATLSLLVRTRLAQNPSDGVDVANTICSLVPNGAVAVAGTLILRALGV